MKNKRSGIPLIAELAGVSIGTVDRALHRRPGINDETRQKVLDIAKKIGYRPNLAARSLSTGRRIRIGVCVPREIRYFYNEMWDGIHDEVRRYKSRGVPRRGCRPTFRCRSSEFPSARTRQFEFACRSTVSAPQGSDDSRSSSQYPAHAAESPH